MHSCGRSVLPSRDALSHHTFESTNSFAAMFQLHHCHRRQIPFHHTDSESSSSLEKIGKDTRGANPLALTQGRSKSASSHCEKQDRVRKSKTHNHYCGRDGLDAFHGLSLFTKWWDGNVAACWRHVVVMCVVLLLVLPLLLLTEGKILLTLVVIFATCVFWIIKRNKE